jgi:hypothetical protein
MHSALWRPEVLRAWLSEAAVTKRLLVSSGHQASLYLYHLGILLTWDALAVSGTQVGDLAQSAGWCQLVGCICHVQYVSGID